MCDLIGQNLFYIHLKFVCTINLDEREYHIGQLCYSVRKCTTNIGRLAGAVLELPSQILCDQHKNLAYCYYVTNSGDAMAR